MLIAVFGLPGSGKSYFASHLAEHIDAVYLSSDKLRKEMLTDIRYSPEEKEKVYQKLLEKAEEYLRQKQAVVIDATFHQATRRKELTALAARVLLPLFWIEVFADEKLIQERVSGKRKNSDADFAVYRKIKAAFEPFKEKHLRLESTNHNLQEMLEKALEYLNDEK